MNGTLVASIPKMDRLTLLDITKTRTRPGRFDTDGDKLARLLRCFRGQGQGLLKCCAICNDMIGWEHGHCSGVIVGRDPTSAKRDRRGRVAFRWFGENILPGKIREQSTNCRLLLCICQN